MLNSKGVLDLHAAHQCVRLGWAPGVARVGLAQPLTYVAGGRADFDVPVHRRRRERIQKTHFSFQNTGGVFFATVLMLLYHPPRKTNATVAS